MKIKRVIIQKNDDYREFVFDDKINLIYSKENSKGKTTLLRAILFGLGYNIPATDGIKTFDDFYIHIDLIEKSQQYSLERKGDIVTLNEENEKITYIVPEQIYELHSKIFKISDIMILNNLLAVFYIDQEKGWTLLNRGIIIGKNRFNIEDFISTLSEKDVSSINNEIKKLEDEIRKYRSLKSIAEYKNENIIEEVTSYRKNDDNELYNKLKLLKMREVEIKNDIKDVSGILKDNKKLIDYLEKLDIYVKISDDSSIKLSKENILNYNENQIFYETRKKELEINLAKVKDEINKIEDELDDRNIFFNVKTVADEVDDMLKEVNINESQMDKIIGQLTRRKQKLMNELHEILSENNKYLNAIYNTIKKYAKELNFDEYIGDSPKFVLTNKLKGKTGRILTHMAFSFKMAYLLEIKNKYGLILPIIIDSPRTNELTDDASVAMIKILERDFKEHQVILASVYDFKEINKKIIEMKENLFC